jgi:hypothetical protein
MIGMAHQSDKLVHGLGQQHDNVAGGVVVLGAAPDQVDDAHDGIEAVTHILKVLLVQLLKGGLGCTQIDLDVLGLGKRLRNIIADGIEGPGIAALHILFPHKSNVR